jgi:hypothetical protein
LKKRHNNKWKDIFNEIFSIYSGKIENEVSYETISEDEPTVIEFKNWMQSISEHIGKQNKKLIIVYDNMDRLPAEKVKELWSSIHTFFSEDGFDNIWAIIPFDEKHLSCAFGEFSDKEQLTKYFISKTFPVVYRVTPPVITDAKKIFNTLFEEAFGNTETKQQEDINRIFRLEKQNATVRDMIEFVNQLVALKNIWKDEIDILYMAIFVLKKDEILSNSTLAEQILSGNYLGNYIPSIVSNNEILQKNISALVYGVSLDIAEQIPMSKYLDSCFNLEENTDINKFANSSIFIDILNDKVKISDNAQLDNIIQCLSKLESSTFSEENKTIMTLLWNTLAQKKMTSSFEMQEFDSVYQNILLHTDKTVQKESVKHLCEKIQQFDTAKFSGIDYFTSLSQIKDFVEKHNIEFDILAELQEKEVYPKYFLDYVIAAKVNYPLFKLTTNPNDLDEYFITLSPDAGMWRQNQQPANKTVITNYSHDCIIEILPNLKNDKVYKFDKFLNSIEKQIPNAIVNNFKQYFDVYKILSDEKPLKVQLNPTQRQNIWNTLASKPNTPEYLEIVAMQIIQGIDTGSAFNQQQQIEIISKSIEYYANYGDLLKKCIGWNIPILNQVLKNLTEKSQGTSKLSIKEILPLFEHIKNKIKVEPSVLLNRLNTWYQYAETIQANEIQNAIIPLPIFYEYSSKTKNNLTDLLNKKAIDALSAVSLNTLLQNMQNNNEYWTIVVKNFIDTEFLNTLPDNLFEAGIKALDEISAGRRTIPSSNDVLQKVIEKLDRKKTVAYVKDIRDKYCNSQYNITPQLFLYFESWFEKQGDLKQSADRATHKIIEPVVNDTNCLNSIISKSDYYADIINAAGDDAITLKDIMRNKIKNSTDTYLIAFAKKIGVEKKKIEM